MGVLMARHPQGVPCLVPQPRFLLGLSLCSLERANTVYLREGTGSLDTRPSFSLELVRDLETRCLPSRECHVTEQRLCCS